MADGDGIDRGQGDAGSGGVVNFYSDLSSTAVGKGASLVGINDAAGYFAATNVETALAELFDIDLPYNVMSFVPQNLKSAIRGYTSTTDVSVYVQIALNAAIADGRGVFFPRGRYVAPGLSISGYLGNGLKIDGAGAVIRLGANETGLSITNSERVYLGRGIRFDSTAASGASQIGVLLTNSARLEIAGEYELLTYGIKAVSEKVGLATHAGVSIPSRLSPIAKACTTAVWLTATAEYIDIVNANITDCTGPGAIIGAGNCGVSGGHFMGNDIGIEVTGGESSNGDHGKIVGAVINHNARANLYLHDFDWSFLVTGCNIWASVSTNFGAGPLATSFGVYAKTVKNLNLTNNVIARSKVNVGIDGMTTSQVCHNTFLADSASTTQNILEISALTVANGNIMAPNTFEGALLAGANNNDYEQTHTVGAAGEPAFANSWVNFGAPFTSAAFRKDAAGFVHLAGMVKTGTVTASIFVLPATYRPLTTLQQSVISNGAIGIVKVDATGAVIANAGNNTYFSIDGISFKAEA